MVTFDGEVIECFGFSTDPSTRFHVAYLTEINADEGGRFSDASVNFKSSKQIGVMQGIFTPEEFKSPEMLDAIRAAAPNLESG